MLFRERGHDSVQSENTIVVYNAGVQAILIEAERGYRWNQPIASLILLPFVSHKSTSLALVAHT